MDTSRRCGVPQDSGLGMLVRMPTSRPRRWRALLAGLSLAALVASTAPAFGAADPGGQQTDAQTSDAVGTADSTSARQISCRRGWISLTFDDGPDPVRTARLVRILTELDVPATFFMVGQRVQASPETVRLVARHGFQVANHSYRHQDMRTQTLAGVRLTLRNTQRALVKAGVTPTHLMRPPYGSINRRIEQTIRDSGYVPVLWTVDSADWAGGNARQIADRILARLHPNGTNIVLQHDGVTNSPASIGAVRRVVEVARDRGYCFTDLTRRGTSDVPPPTARVTSLPAREGTHASVRIRLSHPASGPASVRVRATGGSAGAGDFEALTRTVRFAAGENEKTVQLAVTPDEVPEADEQFAVELDQAEGLVLASQLVTVGIRDARKPPSVAVAPAVVREPATRQWALAKVRVWLGRASGNDVTVTLQSSPGTAGSSDFALRTRTVTIPAGATEVWASFPVAKDRRHEGRERFEVRITSAENAVVARGRAWVTILP